MNKTILNGYLITDENQMKKIILEEWKPSDKRSVKSYIIEWVAHNVMFNHNMFVSHTKDVDLNEDEYLWRRICYFIIYCLHKQNVV